jgi:hypothetical protein
MCLGPELAMLAVGAAASAAGGMMNAKSQQHAAERANNQAHAEAEARNQKLAEYTARQQQFAKQAQDANQVGLDKYAQPQQVQQQADATQQRENLYAQAAPETNPTEGIPLRGDTPEVVKSEMAKRMLAAHQESTDRAKHLAAQGGVGDSWLQNQFNTDATGRQVDTINNFSRGDIALLPASQDRAAYKVAVGFGPAKPPNPTGGILQGIGNTASAAAGSGRMGSLFG